MSHSKVPKTQQSLFSGDYTLKENILIIFHACQCIPPNTHWTFNMFFFSCGEIPNSKRGQSLKWNHSQKQKAIHPLVSSGALPTINWALMDKRISERAISTVIATKRKRSYVRAVHTDSYLIPTAAKIGLMLDWSSVAFDSPRQQRFEIWWD